MNITVEKQPNCKAAVRVDIPKEKSEEMRSGVVNYYMHGAKLPGFRPGKAPRAVVERRFAEDIRQAVHQQLAEMAVAEAAKKENLQVLGIENAKIDEAEGGGHVMTFDATLRPEISLPEYKGLKIQVQRVEINDELVDKVIARQREQFATLKDVEGRPCQMGDFVVVDYSGKIDGKPIKELVPESEAFIAENAGFLLKLDSANFLPGFCDQVAGAKVEEAKVVVARIPDEANSAVAGKDAVYDVTVKAVKEQQLPEVNDELAARLLPGKTLEEVRVHVRERLEADSKQNEEQQKRQLVVQALRQAVEFELPKSLVNNAAQRRVNELVESNLKRGVDQETLVANEQVLLDKATEQAEVDVKEEFLLTEIAKKEGLRVTEDEMNLRISNIAATARTSPKQVVKLLKQNNSIDNLRFRVLMEKTVDFLVGHAEISHVVVSPDEQE